MLVLFVLTQSANYGAGVGLWDVFETSYSATNQYANPFTDLEI